MGGRKLATPQSDDMNKRRQQNNQSDKSVISNDAKRARLTLEELRQYPGLESIDEKEGYAAIASLENYSRILFELFTEHKRNKHER